MKHPFNRGLKSNYNDGDYSVLVTFDGMERRRFLMLIEDGICYIKFPWIDNQGKSHEEQLAVTPNNFLKCDSSDTDFIATEKLPNPFLSFSTNRDLLSNLKTPYVSFYRNKIEFKVNGISHLSPNSSGWINFPNFLHDYVIEKFGKRWFNQEFSISTDEQHPIARLFSMFSRKVNNSLHVSNQNRIISVRKGIVLWLMDFAYNLFWVDNNHGLQKQLIARLKFKDQFWGAAHELFVAAAFLRAGFSLEFEDEADRSKKHPEFTATHAKTGDVVTVEAKVMHRKQIREFRFDDWKVKGFRPGRLVNDAIKKAGQHPHIIVLDMNLPPAISSADQIRFNDAASGFLKNQKEKSYCESKSWNAIYVVNRPFLFSEKAGSECVYSTVALWNARSAVKHPSIVTGASINQVFNSMDRFVEEIERVTRVLKSRSKTQSRLWLR